MAGNLVQPKTRHPLANWSSWKSGHIRPLARGDPDITILEMPRLRTMEPGNSDQMMPGKWVSVKPAYFTYVDSVVKTVLTAALLSQNSLP